MKDLMRGELLRAEAWLRVQASSREELVGNAALVGQHLIERGVLTGVLTVVFETLLGPDEIITNDPAILLFKPPSKLSKLDERGLAKIGSVVEEGDVLIGQARKKSPKMMLPEEIVARSIFGDTGAAWADLSVVWPYQEPGLVLEVSSFSQASLPGYRVLVGISRPLREGDVLEEVATKKRFVVAGLFHSLDSEVDLLVAPGASRPGCCKFRKRSKLLSQKVSSRSIGPYDLLNQMPLGYPGSGLKPGIPLQQDEVKLLHQAGLRLCLRELLAFKSGALNERVQAYKAVLNGKEVAISGTSEVVYRLFFCLRGLGLHPVFLDAAGRKLEFPLGSDRKAPAALVVNLAKPAEILAWSSGRVETGECMAYQRGQSFKPVAGGLMCERIFGPCHDFTCACGKYIGYKFAGKVCNKCGVEVTDSFVRRRRMGHIELPQPIFNPIFSGIIADKIGLTEEEIDKLARGELAVVVASDEDSLLTQGQLIPAELSVEADNLKAISGSEAIRWLMAQHGLEPEGFFLEVIPVIPPEFRPMVRINELSFVNCDLNTLYRLVIERVNRLAKLRELHAPGVILANEERMVFEAVQALFSNRLRFQPRRGPGGQPLVGLDEHVERAISYLFQRRVDYAGVGVVIPNPKLKLRHLGLPPLFAAELFKPQLIRELIVKGGAPLEFEDVLARVREGDASLIKTLRSLIRKFLVVVIGRRGGEPVLAVMRPVLEEVEEALTIHPRTARALGIRFEGDSLKLFLPLSKQAQEEAKGFFYPPSIPPWPTKPLPHLVLNNEENGLDSVLAGLTVPEFTRLAVEDRVLVLTELDRASLGA